MWQLRRLLQTRLFHFLSSYASVPVGESKSSFGSDRQLVVLGSLSQLLSWTANEVAYSELTHRSSPDDPNAHCSRQSPGVPACTSPYYGTDKLVPSASPGYLAGEGLQGPHLLNVPNLLEAVQGLDLPNTAIAVINDAVRESVVGTNVFDAVDGCLYTNCSENICHCELDEGACAPETQKVILDSTLAEDPQIAEWLKTAFGIHR